MTEYHTIYKGPPGETTQWEDIQRKMGNLPPKEPVFKPEKFTPEQDEVRRGLDNQWRSKQAHIPLPRVSYRTAQGLRLQLCSCAQRYACTPHAGRACRAGMFRARSHRLSSIW